MSANKIYDILHQTDHVLLSKILNGGISILDANERLIYEKIAKQAGDIGWTHERIMSAMQRVIEQ
ncbi:MAG: hypothetical protein HQL01_05780 [Nitrospirae bacterium]|nr:hypothetical protein [Nitrospirota bacterium]